MPKVYPYIAPTREETMVMQYGECVSQKKAAEILNCSSPTIAAMLNDGRLKRVCEGKKVCVRSIAYYMEKPAEADFAARQRRKRPNQRYYVCP